MPQLITCFGKFSVCLLSPILRGLRVARQVGGFRTSKVLARLAHMGTGLPRIESAWRWLAIRQDSKRERCRIGNKGYEWRQAILILWSNVSQLAIGAFPDNMPNMKGDRLLALHYSPSVDSAATLFSHLPFHVAETEIRDCPAYKRGFHLSRDCCVGHGEVSSERTCFDDILDHCGSTAGSYWLRPASTSVQTVTSGRAYSSSRTKPHTASPVTGWRLTSSKAYRKCG